jgi:hypothetical protein
MQLEYDNVHCECRACSRMGTPASGCAPGKAQRCGQRVPAGQRCGQHRSKAALILTNIKCPRTTCHTRSTLAARARPFSTRVRNQNRARLRCRSPFKSVAAKRSPLIPKDSRCQNGIRDAHWRLCPRQQQGCCAQAWRPAGHLRYQGGENAVAAANACSWNGMMLVLCTGLPRPGRFVGGS